MNRDQWDGFALFFDRVASAMSDLSDDCKRFGREADMAEAEEADAERRREECIGRNGG